MSWTVDRVEGHTRANIEQIELFRQVLGLPAGENGEVKFRAVEDREPRDCSPDLEQEGET